VRGQQRCRREITDDGGKIAFLFYFERKYRQTVSNEKSHCSVLYGNVSFPKLNSIEILIYVHDMRAYVVNAIIDFIPSNRSASS